MLIESVRLVNVGTCHCIALRIVDTHLRLSGLPSTLSDDLQVVFSEHSYKAGGAFFALKV